MEQQYQLRIKVNEPRLDFNVALHVTFNLKRLRQNAAYVLANKERRAATRLARHQKARGMSLPTEVQSAGVPPVQLQPLPPPADIKPPGQMDNAKKPLRRDVPPLMPAHYLYPLPWLW